MYNEETIAAISTALSPSGIGIIRVCGRDSIEKISRIYRKGRKYNNSSFNLKETSSHTIHYGYIYDGDEIVDEVLVMVMHSPKTYTGENTVEIDCHGGIYSVRRVLETVLKQNIRLAEPGEFTKRAFLNGKIDLSQAEAVMDVIEAKNDNALKNSLNQLKGSVRDEIISIRKKFIYEMAFIESALDDPEHFSLDGYPSNLSYILKEQCVKLEKLIKSFHDGKLLREGIKTVIIGKPNAGKSSLLNILLGEDRAIVTDIAGTTRDTLEEYIELNGISLKIIDTAGIRFTEDKVEKIGVERAYETASDADLILYVFDSSSNLDENDQKIIKLIEAKTAIILYNKTDLEPKTNLSILESIGKDHPIIPVSIKEGTGIEELGKAIKSLFFNGNISFSEDLVITNVRHRYELEKALNSTKLALESINNGLPEDFYIIDLRDAYDHLGNIIGQNVGDDLINEIFSKFCIGK